jgi:two-component system, OmpR family, response regulator
MGRVLVVEDDARMTRLVARALRGAGFAVSHAATGSEGLYSALDGDFDLVVLDLRLPDMSGTEVLRRLLREQPGQRVLVVSGLSEVDTRVACLDAGADDFLAKPFAIAELLARVRVRAATSTGESGNSVLVVGPIRLDLRLQRASAGGRQVGLSAREFALLRYLMERAGQGCTRAELLAAVWGLSDEPNSNVLDVCVRRLRNKLGRADRVETLRRVGYRFTAG